jgi:hypothetical protein
MAKFQLEKTILAIVRSVSSCLRLCALVVAASCGGSALPDGIDGSASEASKAEASVGFEPQAEAEVQGRPDATMGAEAYAGPCYIVTAAYDQSCSVDSDCVGTLAPLGGYPVESGDYCGTGCFCGGEAINKNAVAQFSAAVSKTPLFMDTTSCGFCPFVSTVACCQNGHCTTGCPETPTEAGGQEAEAPVPGSVLCGLLTGPLDAGSPDSGPTRLCVPPEVCVPFNGAWACCVLPGGAGGSICFGLPGDAG